jgi:hypothetical protein
VEKNPADNGKNPFRAKIFRPARNKRGRCGVDQKGGTSRLFKPALEGRPK